MRGKGYSDVLVAQGADGTAITASTTETRLQHSAARCVLPGGYFEAPAKTIEIWLRGRISTVVTTPGTLTLRLKLGSTVTTGTGAVTGGVSAWGSGAFALNTVGKTDREGTRLESSP